jgi:hypothetical protein
LKRDPRAIEILNIPRIEGIPGGEPAAASAAIIREGYNPTSGDCSFGCQYGPVLGNKPGGSSGSESNGKLGLGPGEPNLEQIGHGLNSLMQALPPSSVNGKQTNFYYSFFLTLTGKAS